MRAMALCAALPLLFMAALPCPAMAAMPAAAAAAAMPAAAPTANPGTSTSTSIKKAAPQREQREPTAAERASFDEFFAARNGNAPQRPWGPAPLFAPAFDIERQRGKPWRVIARVDSAPSRSAPDLCRQIRSTFIYDAAKPKGERWTDSAEAPQWYVWLAQPNVPCQTARYTVLMNPALPPADAVALLRQHRELLLRARLLFAGNSQCARQRALTFRLAALEPAAAITGAPVMFGLVFESDRDTVARVAVRKSRTEYAAWNVNCSG
jgi:hypothetical protein